MVKGGGGASVYFRTGPFSKSDLHLQKTSLTLYSNIQNPSLHLYYGNSIFNLFGKEKKGLLRNKKVSLYLFLTISTVKCNTCSSYSCLSVLDITKLLYGWTVFFVDLPHLDTYQHVRQITTSQEHSS